MNLNPFKMISSEMQKMLLGGLVGSLSYWADRALAETYVSYPAELKAKLAPQLPPNDEILTTVAPPAVMWVLGKKSAKLKEIGKGTILYSVPRLIDRVIVNAMTPTATAGALPLRTVTQARTVTPISVRTVAPVTPSVGKYR